MIETLIFTAFASLLVFSSLMVITRKNQVASAVYLIISLFIVAALFALQGADFVAAIQILVYAGAIMVLFLFVIMLLNLPPDELGRFKFSVFDAAFLVLSIVALIIMGSLIASGDLQLQPGTLTEERVAASGGNTRVLGITLFQDYVWPFELASFLILLAIVASIVIARKPKAGEPK